MAEEKQIESDYAELIGQLNRNKVEYLIVGGYAVVYHTNIPRFTEDIDFWIKATRDNAKRCSKAIKEFSGLNVSPDALLAKDEINFIGSAPNRIDFFNAQGALDFDKAFKNKTAGHFRDEKAWYINMDDLIAAKRHHLKKGDRNAFKADKDLTDIKRLEKKKLK